MDVSYSDRRVFDRLNGGFPLSFTNDENKGSTEGLLEDISGEGARVTLQRHLSTDDTITLHLDLPDGHTPLILSGLVVWTKDRGTGDCEVGVRFKNVNLMHMHRIVKLCQ